MASLTEWFLGIALFCAVFAASFLLLLPQEGGSSGYDFVVREGGTVFYSNTPPTAFLHDFRDNNTFIVSVELVEEQKDRSALGNAFVLLQAILGANNKSVISLVEYYSNSTLQYCQTNYGDLNQDRQITVEECAEMLSAGTTPIIKIKDVDSSLEDTSVFLEHGSLEAAGRRGSITIAPKTGLGARDAAYTVLKTMYSDSGEKIAQINSYLGSATK